MTTKTIKAEKRDVLGHKVKRLREKGFLPANIYGKGVKSLSIQVKTSDFEKVFAEAGETQIIEILLGKDKRNVLISNVQTDPVTDAPLHADLRQVDLKQKVSADVPVELIGESPAEKDGVGTAVLYIDEIKVEALPADLPEKFEVDISVLDAIDKAILIKDIALKDEKVRVELDPEEIVVKVEPLMKEEEVAPPPSEEAVEGEASETKEEEPEEQEKEETKKPSKEEEKEA